MVIKLSRGLFFICAGIVLSFFIVGSSNAATQGEPNSSSNTYSIKAAALLGLINEDRESSGVSSLAHNSKLDISAAAKCQDMVLRKYWGHQTPDGKTFDSYIVQAGYRSYRTLGENLAIGQTGTAEVNADWLASPSHRDNILNSDFKEAGIAVCVYPNYTPDNQPALLTVMHFAEPS